MAAQKRIYRVVIGGADRLVRATHPSTAFAYVARLTGWVRVATQEDLETMLPQGVKVEEIRAEQAELPTE